VAKFILRNAFIQVNGVNLSDHCSEVTVESTADKVDLTAFGAAGYRDYGQGFKDATITAKFYQDYAARASTRPSSRCMTTAARSPSTSRPTPP
jgi:hypothetical protein